MQFPQNPFDFGLRSTQTRYLSELAELQSSKNRSYTQLKTGDTKNLYIEANLGNVQLFREKLSVATHIHAAPPARFLPLAAMLPHTADYRFCGQARQESSLLQAMGDEWDVCSDGQLDYVAFVFDYPALNQHYHNLYQQELPQSWLMSRSIRIDTSAMHRYKYGSSHLLHLLTQEPALFQNPKACQFIAAQSMQLAIETLKATQTDTSKPSSYSRRIRGVYRVIDYLQVYASHLPCVADLCAIANLSERSLEYGFREYLGVTPIRYLKLVRLNGVRKTLLMADKPSVKVSEAAMQWGFLELGRFSKEYQQLFDELPSATLKKASLDAFAPKTPAAA